jgi:hypothetical protein
MESLLPSDSLRGSIMTLKERGKGQLSSLLWLIIFGLAVYSGWNVIPVYIANYSFADKVEQVARLPRGTNSDEVVRDALMKHVEECNLSPYISRQSCSIRTEQHRRVITCSYEREATVLPGIPHTFRFNISADQPLIF